MRNKGFMVFGVLGLAVILSPVLLGCRPAGPVASGPAPEAAPPPVASRPVAAAPGPEDAEWANVVKMARKEGTVTAYSVSWPGDVGLALAQAFWDRYNVKMENISSKGAEFIERIKVEQRVRQYVVDVNQGSPTSMNRIKADGFSVSLAGMTLPILREKGVWHVEPFANDPEGFSVAYQYSPINIWINTKLVAAASEPRSFRDLLQPQWKGKMTIADPVINSAPYMGLVTLVNRKALDWDYVKALGRQGLILARTTDDMYVQLSRGNASIATIGPDATAGKYVLEGAPIKPVAPEEGTVVNVSAVAIIKNAPHPNAAKLLVNWLASQGGQTVFTRATGVASTRKDVADFRPPAVRVENKKLYLHTEEDNLEAVEKMRDRFIPNLWKQ